jgi:thiopeptide-type bacteriocin biosynthesis protein
MDVAHRLWHLDSRHLLTYLAATTDTPATRLRRELALLLSSTMLRAAGLDWYEQGDVWARVANHRDPPDHSRTDDLRALQSPVRRLMSVDINSLARSDAPLTAIADWAAAYTAAGRDLARLASDGLLRRGLRDTLAHHVIFAANRLGLPAAVQAVLATTASTVVFGDSDTHATSRSTTGNHSGVASPAATGAINGIEEHRC